MLGWILFVRTKFWNYVSSFSHISWCFSVLKVYLHIPSSGHTWLLPSPFIPTLLSTSSSPGSSNPLYLINNFGLYPYSHCSLSCIMIQSQKYIEKNRWFKTVSLSDPLKLTSTLYKKLNAVLPFGGDYVLHLYFGARLVNLNQRQEVTGVGQE